jgi:hypothetical protein
MLRFASALRRVAPAALARQPPARGLAFGDVPVPGDARVKHVTVLPGHGIGPELMRAAMAVLKATGAPLAFEVSAAPLQQPARRPAGVSAALVPGRAVCARLRSTPPPSASFFPVSPCALFPPPARRWWTTSWTA